MQKATLTAAMALIELLKKHFRAKHGVRSASAKTISQARQFEFDPKQPYAHT